MEWDDLDNKIKEKIEASDTYYAPQVDQAYSSIWNAVEKNDKGVEVFWYKWIAVAAVFLLLLVSTGLFIVINQNDGRTIVLKNEVDQLQSMIYQQDILLNSKDELIKGLVKDQSILIEENASINAMGSSKDIRLVHDTIYIRRTNEVAKVLPQPLLVEHTDPGESGLKFTGSLNLPEEPVKEIVGTKLQFVFEDTKNLQKNKKKGAGLKFRIGSVNKSSQSVTTQVRPLSLQTRL